MTAIPRVVVAAPFSGHGKTAVAVGLLAAFAARGLKTAGFKVGPDHIDAAYLGLAARRPARNLDPRLVGPHRVPALFGHGAAGADLAVIEGTMGLYDSLGGHPDADSTAGVATALRAPVVLVIDAASMGQSIAALVHGFRAYDETIWLAGVILNRVASPRHEQLLREALDEIGVPVLGALGRADLAPGGPTALPPRAYGVVPVLHRGLDGIRAVRRLGEAVAASVDLDAVHAVARAAPRFAGAAWSPAEALAEADPGEPTPRSGPRPLVAIAGTPAGPYGYPEAAELLVAAGADVVPVDPLRDEALPPGTDALVIGGGLPEAYAEELAANQALGHQVANLAAAGRPVIAEGTGLLWLIREYDGRPMCGVLDAQGRTAERAVVGYREATARTSSPLAHVGARVVGYKHHRAVVEPRAGQSPAWSWAGGAPEGFVWRRVHASFLTLHWAGLPEAARRLVAAAPAQQLPAPPSTPPVSPAVSMLISPPATGPLSGAPPVSGGGEEAEVTERIPVSPAVPQQPSAAPVTPAFGPPAEWPAGPAQGLQP